MRVLVTGGRKYADRERLFQVMDRVHAAKPISVLIHGAASGADQLAAEWAELRSVEALSCPPDWRRYGRGAGPMRNRQMLKERPALLVAFPGGSGTADMIAVAIKAHIAVLLESEVDFAERMD